MILILFNVYGPYEDHKGNQASPYTKFTTQAKQSKIINVFENSEDYKRDFVCVDDICAIHEKMLSVDKTDIWNIGTGSPESFENVARTIAKRYGAEIKYIPMPDNLKGQYQKYTCADLTKLNSVIDHKWIDIKDYINGS
jgi:ADP-L-glycero-D-manno-heptose 6-epimerase